MIPLLCETKCQRIWRDHYLEARAVIHFFVTHRHIIDRQTHSTHRQTERQTERETDRHTYTQTDRETDRQTGFAFLRSRCLSSIMMRSMQCCCIALLTTECCILSTALIKLDRLGRVLHPATAQFEYYHKTTKSIQSTQLKALDKHFIQSKFKV